MTKSKQVIAVLLAVIMAFSSFAVLGSAGFDSDGNLIVTVTEGTTPTVTLKTVFYDTAGNAIADMAAVTPGTSVKARVYLGANYYTTGGEIVFRVDNDFFDTSALIAAGNAGVALTVNTANAVVTANGITAKAFVNTSITDADNTVVTVIISRTGSDLYLYSATDWLFSFDFTVSTTAYNDDNGQGQAAADASQLRTEANKDGYANIPYGDSTDNVANVVDSYYFTATTAFTNNTLTVNNTVTFDANGGEFADASTTKQVSGVIGQTYNIPTAPTRDGYTFLGWTLGGETAFAATDTTFTLPIGSGIVYSAAWGKNVTINFAQTGDSTIASITNVVGGTAWATHPDNPARAGYKFMGWTGQDVTDGALPANYPTPTAENDVFTYTATWAPYVSITFDANGGAFSDGNTGTYTDNSTIYGGNTWNTATVPTYNVANYAAAGIAKTGYAITGWQVIQGGTVVDTITTFPTTYPTADTTYKAVWNARGITISYQIDADGNSATTDDITVAEEFNVLYDDGTYTVETISGISSWTNGGNTYASGSTYTFAAADVGGKVVFIGTPTATSHHAIFVVDGTTVSDNTYAEGTAITAPTDPAKEGYTFKGWSPAVGNMDTQDITFTATWEKIAYTITYVNGTSQEVFTVNFGDELEIPADPEKDGWTFVKWNDGSGNEPSYYATMPASNLTFTAEFSQNAVTVTYYAYGTDAAKAADYSQFGDAQTVAIGAALATLTPPTYTNYTFSHWADADGTTHADGEAVNTALSLYAVYDRVVVKLVPKDATSTAMIERDGVVETYNTGLATTPYGVTTVQTPTAARIDTTDHSKWYVYGLKEGLTATELADYVAVTGDGHYEVTTTTSGDVGTGAIIKVYDNVTSTVVEEFYIVIFGDLDGDTYILASDSSQLVTELRNHAWSTGTVAVPYMIKAADIDLDGYILASDSSGIISAIRKTVTIDQKTGKAS